MSNELLIKITNFAFWDRIWHHIDAFMTNSWRIPPSVTLQNRHRLAIDQRNEEACRRLKLWMKIFFHNFITNSGFDAGAGMSAPEALGVNGSMALGQMFDFI